MRKKLKLTKLTVANLERVKGGIDPVCLCQVFPGGGTDEAFHHVGIKPSKEIFCILTARPC